MQKFAIHGLPRSGTTWIGEVFNSSPSVCYRYQPLFSYALQGFLNKNSSALDIEEFYHQLILVEDEFLDQKEARKDGRLPIFIKKECTHVGYKEVRYHHLLPNLLESCKDLKCFLVLRNPIAVINSWLNAPKEFRADLGWNFMDEWRKAPKKNLGRPEEYNGYEKWKEATLLFIHLAKQYPEQVMLLRYDAWLSQPLKCAEGAFSFLGLSVGYQTQKFLCSLVEDDYDPYSVMRNKKKDDRWESELEPEIANLIEADLRDSPLRFLLDPYSESSL